MRSPDEIRLEIAYAFGNGLDPIERFAQLDRCKRERIREDRAR